MPWQSLWQYSRHESAPFTFRDSFALGAGLPVNGSPSIEPESPLAPNKEPRCVEPGNTEYSYKYLCMH